MKSDYNAMVREELAEYKVMNDGIENLTSVELIALVLGSGKTTEDNMRMARQLMNVADDMFSLREMRPDEMQVVQGISQRKAIAIKAAVEIGRRLMGTKDTRKRVIFPKEVYLHMSQYMAGLNHEEAYIILCNNQYSVLATKRISVGGFTETAVDVRVIMREAVMANATVVGLCHNHPSGNKNPSKDDDNITRRVRQACDVMRLHFLDHIIYTDYGFYSYRENGKL